MELDKDRYIEGLEAFAVAVLTKIDLKMLVAMLELENEEQVQGFCWFVNYVLDRTKERVEEDMSWADNVDEGKVN